MCPSQDVHGTSIHPVRFDSMAAVQNSFDDSVDRLSITPPQNHDKPSELQIDEHVTADENPVWSF